jgi:malate dehydrogenase (oxaloacetate-decarboxylating)
MEQLSWFGGSQQRLKLTGRSVDATKIVISGAGAAGVACANILSEAGIRDIVVVDSQGIIGPGRTDLGGNKGRPARTYQSEAAIRLGSRRPVRRGRIHRRIFSDARREEPRADGCWLDSLALSNPTQEIDPDVAARYARVVRQDGATIPIKLTTCSPSLEYSEEHWMPALPPSCRL